MMDPAHDEALSWVVDTLTERIEAYGMADQRGEAVVLVEARYWVLVCVFREAVRAEVQRRFEEMRRAQGRTAKEVPA